MSIETRCPNTKCNAPFAVTEDQLGKTAICKKCGMRLKISWGVSIPLFDSPIQLTNKPKLQEAVPALTQPHEAVTQRVQPPLADVPQLRAAATQGAFAPQPSATRPVGGAPDVTQAAGGPETPQTFMTQPAAPTSGSEKHALEQTIAQVRSQDREKAKAVEDAVPAEWKVGDVILDTYEVKRLGDAHDYAEGGFGRVYRVHHRDWDQDMAVKSPRPEYLADESHKENFVRECLTWVGLGLHQHIVCCYYVRMLGGIPRVFAEYVEGGSLKDWIENRKLYGGAHEQALARMLDIAIQFAWGLHYAHEKGLIHQDVKPHNVMMTPDGVAKVSDFGLAKARAVAGQQARADAQQSILVSTGGMTPAYCSPEQANKQPLSRKTDIWSWGLSILEMFAGDVFWRSGEAAPEALASYLEMDPEDDAIPKMPASLVELLRRCFERNPDARPKDMIELVESLKLIYATDREQGGIGRTFDRPDPKPPEMLADALNNQGISLLDLGQREDAERAFDEALTADPHHPEATFNLGLLEWRRGQVSDQELLERMEHLRSSHAEDWADEYLLSLIHLERGDAASASKLLQEAANDSSDDRTVISALRIANADLHKWGSLPELPHGYADEQELPDRYRGKRDKRGLGWTVSYSPDGRFILRQMGDSGSKEPVNVYELRTHKRLCKLMVGGPVRSFCVSPDRRVVLTGPPMRVWDVATAECKCMLDGGLVVCVSPEGSLALSGMFEETLRVWDLRTYRCLSVLQGHEGKVSCASLSLNGRYAMSGSDDKTLRLWSLETGKCLRTFVGHASSVQCVSLSNDAQTALSGSVDRTLRIWRVSTGECIHILRGHTSQIKCAYLSADGRWVLSLAHDSTVRLWEVSRGRCLRTFQRWGRSSVEDIYPFCLDMESPAEQGKTAYDDMKPWVVRRAEETLAAPFVLCRSQRSAVQTEAHSRFEKHLDEATAALNQYRIADAHAVLTKARGTLGHERHPQALDLWASLSQKAKRLGLKRAYFRRTLEGPSGWGICVSLSGDGRIAVGGGVENTLWVWEVGADKCVRPLQGHEDRIWSVNVSPDGRWALSGSRDKTVRLWDTREGRCVRVLEGHADVVSSVGLSADGRWGLSGSRDKTVRLWDLATGTPLRVFQGRGPVSLSENGRWALFDAAEYGKACGSVWDMVSGRQICKFECSDNRMNARCLSADGTFVFSTHSGSSVERTPFLWDTASGKLIRVFQGECHGSSAHTPYLSPDGRWAISGGVDHKTSVISVWEVPTGRCVGCFGPQAGSVDIITASADGRWVLSVSDDQIIRLWELEWDLAIQNTGDWDEGVRPHLVRFLTLHTPYAGRIPKGRVPSESEIRLGLTRRGKPVWSEEDFENLLHTLGCAGYGWLRPEGVRRELDKMTSEWTGPPPLPGGSDAPRYSEAAPPVVGAHQDRGPQSASSLPGRSNAQDIKTKAEGQTQVQEGAEIQPAPPDTPTLLDMRKPKGRGSLSGCSAPSDPKAKPPGHSGKSTVRKGIEKTPVGISGTKGYDHAHREDNACARCGRPRFPGARFCVHCDNMLRPDPQPGVGPVAGEPAAASCTCGAVNAAGNRFCKQCGRPLATARERRCASCDGLVPSGVNFCVHCGKEIGDDSGA
jgi:WD40 repeat protein/serine/threonine protein kinase